MSSFPNHTDNIMELKRLGFDVSEALDENGEVTLESWGYDDLTYLVGDIISAIINGDFTPEGKQLVSEDAIKHLHDNYPKEYKEFYDKI